MQALEKPSCAKRLRPAQSADFRIDSCGGILTSCETVGGSFTTQPGENFSHNTEKCILPCALKCTWGLIVGYLILGWAAQLHADATLVENGQPRAALFVPARLLDDAVKNPEQPTAWKNLDAESERRRLRESVKDFAAILQRISGAKIDIVAGSPAPGDTRLPILVGELAEAKFGKPQKSAPYKQGLRIVVHDKAIGLIGESDLGTSYALYTLLDQLGCRWFMPTQQGEVLPSLKTLTLKNQDLSDAPYTICRGVWYCDDDFARRNRMGGLFLAANHALEFTVTKEFRKQHPEIRAVIGGKPNDHRLKWTHPLVAQAISDVCLETLKKNPDLGTFSLGPDDGMSWDESDDRKYDAGDFDPATGVISKTDRLIVLANRVAERVTKQFPNVKFGILAYVDYTRPPVREKVHPAVVPQIAPITFSRGQPMNDDGEPNNGAMRALVNGWAKAVPATSYYYYAYNLAEAATPNPMIAKWSFDVPYAYTNGNCRYWQPETIGNYESCLHALHLANRLAWNPSEKPADIIAELHTKFYGSAAKPMSAFWHAIDDMWVKTPEYSGCGFGHVRRFTPERLAAARKLIGEAQSAAKTDKEKFRVEMASQTLAQLELFMKLRRDLGDGKFATLADDSSKWISQMDALGTKYQPQFAFGRFGWTGASTLHSIYFKDFYKFTYDDATRVARDYKILTSPLLRTWHYQIDKEKAGEAASWFKPEFDDSSWKTTDVAMETWSTLGHHNYMGSMWYRTKLTLPEIPADKKAYLWIGATDGHVKAFVNGRAVKYSGPKGEQLESFNGYCRPVSFDITAALKGGGAENQISLFCTRDFINELGTGGLIAPVAVYSDK